MQTVLTAEEMKKCDHNTINHFGINSAVLMERASLAVAETVSENVNKKERILVFCGPGNNGGDGVCTARILQNYGYNISILLFGNEDKFSTDLKKQLEISRKYGINEVNVSDVSIPDIDDFDVLIDAIFGIGLSRDVSGIFADAIELFNRTEAKKIAIDIPSGINTDTGSVLSVACRVDITVTFNFRKVGHILYPGKEYSGNVIVKDIGINSNSFLGSISPNHYCYDKNDSRRYLSDRKNDSNKGDFGKVLIIAGSNGMSGAAYFSAKAALRMGAGLVKIYTTEDNRSILQTKLPEAIIATYDSFDKDSLEKELDWSTECVIGPGIGTDNTAERITKTVIKNYSKPLIIDADALNIIKNDISVLDNNYDNIIITPHLGEMSRLTGMSIEDIKNDMEGCCTHFTDKYNVITVLKSASTVTAIPDGSVCLNDSGNNGMSTGGSGDVLTGIIAGLIANNIPLRIASGLSVYIHGLAGDMATLNSSEHYVIASDIIDMLKLVLREGLYTDE